MSSYVPLPPPPTDKLTLSSSAHLSSEIIWSLPSTWPKWLVALAIGVPVSAAVITTGYYIYRKQNRSHSGRKTKKPARGTLQGSSKSGVEDERSSTQSPDFSAVSAGKEKTVAEQILAAKNEGNNLFRAKKYAEAKMFYSKAIDLARSNQISDDLSQSLQNRAACNEQLKFYQEVIDDCDAALLINPHYAKAFGRRSRGHEKLGNIHQAFQDLVAASVLTNFQNQDFKDRSEKILQQLATQIAREEMTKRVSSKQKVKLSRSFVRQFGTGFNRDPLKIEMEKLDSYEPEDPLREALKLMQNGDFEKALEKSSDAIVYPGKKRQLARLIRGTIHFLFGNLKDATSDLNNVVSDPDATLDEKSNARIKLSCITLQETMDPDEVISKLTKAIHFDPTNPDIFFHRAQCYMIFGKLTECLEDFRKCQEFQQPRDPNCSFHIAHIEYRIRTGSNPGDFGAVEALERAIVPLDNPEGFVLLAQLFMEMQRYDKADQFFKRAIRPGNDPHNAVVYTQQALLEMVAHESREAAGAFLSKAIGVDENYSAALELMMDLELQAGNFTAARSLYERIMELAKSEMEMISVVQAYQLGVAGHAAYEKLGMTEQGPIPIGNNSTF